MVAKRVVLGAVTRGGLLVMEAAWKKLSPFSIVEHQ